MSDSINKTPPASFYSLRPVREIDRNKHEQVNKDAPHKAPDAHTSSEQGGEEITLSLSIIRALIMGELDDEVKEAFAGFAALGDLTGAIALCDRIERKGMDHIIWPQRLSLRQALENAAS